MMRWLIASWLLIVGVCGLTSMQASAQSPAKWRMAATGSGIFSPMRHTQPGHNQSASVAQAIDLCAPCNDGEECSSGLCPIAQASDTGICTQKCTADGSIACPTGFTCYSPNDTTVSSCVPNDATVCPAIYIGALLNDVCYYPASATGDANLAFERPCADGLICLVFPASGIGACLNECSAIDPNYLCNPNQQCCFGLDGNGYCLASSSSQNVGGCIQIQSVGDSCVDSDASVCINGAVCANTGYDATSKCYGNCSAGATTCPVDSTCAFINNQNICCDANQYNPEDQTTCFPIKGSCKLQVGVACTSNLDCKTSQCKSYDGAKSCSTPCATDADCPGTAADVNEDGVADGGSHCVTIGSGNYCWPKTTPATQPPCFFVSDQEASVGQSSGCNCRAAQTAPVWWLSLVALGARRLRRRPSP